MRMRESVAGGLILEFSGENSTRRADVMASKIRAVMGDETVISRPVRLASFRLRGFDLSVEQEEIRRAVASVGDCPASDITVGEIGRLPSGARNVWVRCPIAVARSLSARGHLTIGWSSAVVEFFRTQRTQCYKCWNFGHVRETCKYTEDRSSLCFRCGSSEHSVRDCRNALRCVLCYANNWDSGHRVGSALCRSAKTPRRSMLRVRNIDSM